MDRRHATYATYPRSTIITPAEAIAAAQARQHDAANRDPDPDPKVAEHEQRLRRLDLIGRIAPVVRTAWWLLDMASLPPVPLDRDLQPAADPLTTVDAVLDHYQANPDHGVGITTGPHPLRPWTYVAVEVDRFANWQEWLKDAAAVTETVRDIGGFADLGDMPDVGRPKERTRHRDTGGFSRLSWTPPPMPRMKQWKVDGTGGQLAKEMKLRSEGRGGWVLIVAPGDVTVRKPRKLTSGVKVLPTGTVLPWEGSRTADGWTLTLQAAAHSQNGLAPARGDTVTPWLLDKLAN